MTLETQFWDLYEQLVEIAKARLEYWLASESNENSDPVIELAKNGFSNGLLSIGGDGSWGIGNGLRIHLRKSDTDSVIVLYSHFISDKDVRETFDVFAHVTNFDYSHKHKMELLAEMVKLLQNAYSKEKVEEE